MNEHENCPCEAVRELKKIVERHEQQLATGATSFALIKQDLEHIKQAVEKKNRFNANIATTAINVVLTILLTWLVAKLGISV